MKAPYETGDPVSVLFYGNGTCLGTATVSRVTPEDGLWRIWYTLPNGAEDSSVVDERGRDRHGYVARKVS